MIMLMLYNVFYGGFNYMRHCEINTTNELSFKFADD